MRCWVTVFVYVNTSLLCRRIRWLPRSQSRVQRVFSEVEDKKTDKLGRLVGNRYCRIWLPRTTAHVAAGASSTNVYFQKSTASSFGTDGLPVTVRVRISSTGRLEVVDPRNNRDLSDCLTNGATHLVRRWLECVAQYRSLRPLLEKTSLDLSAYETVSSALAATD